MAARQAQVCLCAPLFPRRPFSDRRHHLVRFGAAHDTLRLCERLLFPLACVVGLGQGTCCVWTICRLCYRRLRPCGTHHVCCHCYDHRSSPSVATDRSCPRKDRNGLFQSVEARTLVVYLMALGDLETAAAAVVVVVDSPCALPTAAWGLSEAASAEAVGAHYRSPVVSRLDLGYLLRDPETDDSSH